MITYFKELDSKKLMTMVYSSFALFVVAVFVLIYLNRNLGVIDFESAVLWMIVSFLPGVAMIAVLYVIGDQEARKNYRIRIYMSIIVFGLLAVLRAFN